ncbi:MAG: MerR family transcriptional regulator [Inconstantimicrobium porci]|uniref:MerR family transcriptional regulator n=1 Tax=Inconstantimicrobium porci TaxID=2652291 RepID=UPI002A91DB81|nr:MerR family transcriptional regulator [Inconstantimicrobium porci]MDY5912945.1 MerR family transcriptional regulator [Inconstantimicrobium porci]
MFKIGEFSKLTQVSIRMLRYYDEIGLLKPMSVDKFTGYRMYSAEQIPLLQKILMLRDSKFKISEIQDIVNHHEEVNMVDILEKKKLSIQEEINREKQRIANIDNTINEIENNNLDIHCNINFKKVDEILILSVRDIIPTYNDEGILWDRLYNFIQEENIAVKHQMYDNVAIYHDIEHKDKNVDVEVGVTVNKLGENKNGFTYRKVECVEKMAYAMVYGPYKNIAKGYEMLAYYLEKHNEQMAEKPSRQISHIGVCDTENPEEYLTEIQIPLI